MYIRWRLGWPQFISRDARMCNSRCLHSTMISILCTASQGPSRTIQTALRSPRPESFSLTSYWTGCRLCFAVDLVEEHVGEGGSRSSWPIHEHENSQLVSQQNVASRVFWSQCQPRLTLIARDLARDLRHGMICFIFNVEVLAFMRGTCLGGTLRVTCVTAKQRLSPFYHVSQFLHEKIVFRSPENGTFFLHLARELRHGKQRVSRALERDVCSVTTGLTVL